MDTLYSAASPVLCDLPLSQKSLPRAIFFIEASTEGLYKRGTTNYISASSVKLLLKKEFTEWPTA